MCVKSRYDWCLKMAQRDSSKAGETRVSFAAVCPCIYFCSCVSLRTCCLLSSLALTPVCCAEE